VSEELNNLIDDILKEKLKLHYENAELEAQGKLIKELCKEIERLNNIINELEKYLIEQVEKSYSNDYDNVLDKLDELKGSDKE
jgi:peptidoglycan hydrolase CwlO-like protein